MSATSAPSEWDLLSDWLARNPLPSPAPSLLDRRVLAGARNEEERARLRAIEYRDRMRQALTKRERLEALQLWRAARAEVRRAQAARAGRFGELFVHPETRETLTYAQFAPAAFAAHDQLDLDLPGCNERQAIREALATKLERDLLPITSCDWMLELPARLRRARQRASWGFELGTGRLITMWDEKAGLARLCPDDAREEAMRLRRRVQERIEALQAEGYTLTYCVFTQPNDPAGDLARGMRRIFRRFRALLRARADRRLLFPQVRGALAVLEAPLGAARDWHVHLNVILVHKGFLDWGAVRRRWHWNVEFRQLPRAPGAVGAALTELIKYAVAATVAKSAAHAAEGKTRAPPMLEWTGAELEEWLLAFHRFRRTRAYGCLYGLGKPEAETLGPIVWLGSKRLVGGRYVLECPLLGSIPEDKFPSKDPRERWKLFRHWFASLGDIDMRDLSDPIPTLNDTLEALEQWERENSATAEAP